MRAVVLDPRNLCAAVLMLVAAAPSAAQVARSDVPTFPSAEWFDTGGDDTSGVNPRKYDVTEVHAAFVEVGGVDTAFFRVQTGEGKDEVTTSVGLAGYVDTDGASGDANVYETRFFTIRTKFYDPAEGGTVEDVALIVQRWNDTTLAWQTTAEHRYDGVDWNSARPEADGGGCGVNDTGCRGWVFDSDADLEPSHAAAADRTGVVVLAIPMAELGATQPPRLLVTSYVATAPLSGGAAAVAANIFADGNPCNDPATPYYDASSSTCVANGTFDWKDGPSGQAPFATPVAIDLLERIPGGLRVELSSVHGPTFLELWWRSADGAFGETGVEIAVRAPGVYTLTEDGDRVGGRYVVVDRGVQRVAGVYAEDGARLETDPGLPARLRREPPRGLGQGLARPLGRAHGHAHNPVPEPAGALHFVDVGAGGGVLRLPSTVDGRAVGALWVDGERHLAFRCAEEVRCVLVPPADATRTAPVHRAAIVELAASRPVTKAPRGARGRPALLVERLRLPRRGDVSQWPYPLEHAWGLTWLATPWLPSDDVVIDVPAAELVALELEVSSKVVEADASHLLTVALDGAVVHDARFPGPHAQLRIPLTVSHDGGAAVLTVSTSELAGGERELLALTGAVLEHVRAPVVGDGFYALVREPGVVALDESAFVARRGADGRENAWRVDAGQTIALDDGDEIAVVSLAALEGSALATVYDGPSVATLAGADVVVLVGADGAGATERGALEPWTARWRDAGRDVVVAAFAPIAAALGASPLEGVERIVNVLALDPQGPEAVVLVGSATPVPEQELPDGALHVPAPRRWHEGYTFSSDLGPALDAAASGARLMPVSRVPVVTLAELEATSARLAAAAAIDAPERVIVLSDGTPALQGEASRVAVGVRSALLDSVLVDARVLGRAEALRRAKEGVLSGVGALWYVGHGAFAGLGSNLLFPTHLRAWATEGSPPLTLIAATCYAGNLAGYGADRMPDRLFRWDTPVRAALIGGGQLDVTTHRAFDGALTAAAAEHDEIGALWAAAMRQLLDEGMPADELAAYPLLGDPFAPVR